MRKKHLMILLAMLVSSGCDIVAPFVTTATAPISQTEVHVMVTAQEATSVPEKAVPEGWLTYEDAEHGFYFHYPPEFEVLTDSDSLYGWENGLALLYNGGQSYDIAIQIWDSAAEMEAVYGRGDARMHVFELGDQLISVMNITNEIDNEGIIASFTVWKDADRQ